MYVFKDIQLCRSCESPLMSKINVQALVHCLYEFFLLLNWLHVSSLTTSMIPCVIFNYGLFCTSTWITYIGLWMLNYVWNYNRLCNKQYVMKTLGTKDIIKSILISNSLKVFKSMPKTFSIITCPLLWLLMCNNSIIICYLLPKMEL